MSDLVERLRRKAILERALCPNSKSIHEEAADEIERLSKFLIAANSMIDLLESNARVQAKLLADTGRERDELRRQLTTAYDALKHFASVPAAKKELEYLDKGVGTATARAAWLRACERADQVLEAANAAIQSTKRGGEPNM